MPVYHDALGDELKQLEMTESGRGSPIGEPVVVRVDGIGFSKFTRPFKRPFDERIAAAMDAATVALVDRFHPVLAYTQSDEITLVFYNPDFEIPYDGRYQKLASSCASVASTSFLRKGLELFPERLENVTPVFDGRANGMSRERAARNVQWREDDARRNAVSMAAHAVLGGHALHGKTSADLKDMMREAGVEASDYPERFLRGAFFRRERVYSSRTPKELERIPEAFRVAAAAVKCRSMKVQLMGIPPLSILENLEEFVLDGDDPVAANRPFAQSLVR